MFTGRVPIFDAEVPMFTDRVPIFDAEVPMFTDRVPIFDAGVPMFTGRVPIFDAGVPICDSKVPIFVSEVDMEPHMGTLDPDMGTLDPDMGTLDPDMGTLDPDMGTLDPDMGTLDPNMGTLDPNMGTLDSHMGTLDPHMGTLDPHMGTLEAHMGRILFTMIIKSACWGSKNAEMGGFVLLRLIVPHQMGIGDGDRGALGCIFQKIELAKNRPTRENGWNPALFTSRAHQPGGCGKTNQINQPMGAPRHMAYTGPGSVVSTCDEFLPHWAGVNGSLAPGAISVVPAKNGPAKIRLDLLSLRNMYNNVQTAPGSTPVLPPPAPQYPSIQYLRNLEETGRDAVATGRALVVEAIGAFNRKVRGSLGHTTYPNALPEQPQVGSALAAIIRAGDDMVSLWTTINAQVANPLFTPPLVASYLPEGSSVAVPLTLAEAAARLTALKNGDADVTFATTGLAVMRPFRDLIWERDIRPLLNAYRTKILGDFPPGSAFYESLPNINPSGGSTPDPVTLTAVWNATTNQVDYAWTPSDNPNLANYQVRISPGSTYDADSSGVIGIIQPGEGLSFSSPAGLPASGITISAKVFVVLTTGNERGSNAVAVTRP